MTESRSNLDDDFLEAPLIKGFFLCKNYSGSSRRCKKASGNPLFEISEGVNILSELYNAENMPIPQEFDYAQPRFCMSGELGNNGYYSMHIVLCHTVSVNLIFRGIDRFGGFYMEMHAGEYGICTRGKGGGKLF